MPREPLRPRRVRMADMTVMVTVFRRRTATTLWAPRRGTSVATAPRQERCYVVYLIHRAFREGLLTLKGVKMLMGHIGTETHIMPPDVMTRESCSAVIMPMVTNSRGSMGGADDGAVLGLASMTRGMKYRFSLVPLLCLAVALVVTIRLTPRDPWGWAGSHPATRSRRRLLRAANDGMGTGLICRVVGLAAARGTVTSAPENLVIGLCLGCGRRRGCICRISTIAPRQGKQMTLEREPLLPSSGLATPTRPVTMAPLDLLAMQAMTIGARYSNVRRMEAPRGELMETMGIAKFEGADSRLGRGITSSGRPK